MSTLLAACEGVISRHPRDTGAEWDIVLCERATGVARVRRLGPSLEVTVGDRPAAGAATPQQGDTGWFTSAACGPAGRIRFRSCSAPPALLIGAGSARLHPAVPGGSSAATLTRDERVLMLSSTAFDALPAALVDVLRDLPLHVLHTDPADLLAELFTDIPDGSGAVIRRAAPPSRPFREDR